MNQIDNSLVRRAVEGDKQALEDVILSVQGQVYNLALRMLRLPQDAEDATQEILIKVVTHLSEFRGDSAFTTWVYRVASNHLLNTRRRTAELTNPSFDAMSEQLEASLTIYEANPSAVVEEKMLVEEVKRSCTLGMLMCLDRDQRLALILGELFEVSSEEGAAIMDISPAAYRKRLSRARAAMVAFVSNRCGLVNPASPCRCHKHVRNKIAVGRLDPQHLLYADRTDEASEQEALLVRQEELSTLRRTAALLRSHPVYQSSEQTVTAILQILEQTDVSLGGGNARGGQVQDLPLQRHEGWLN